MVELNCTRKLDSMGRITIPIRLREQYHFEIGQEYPYYFHEDENGAKYLCIRCPDTDGAEVLEAIDKLERLGYEVTPGSY